MNHVLPAALLGAVLLPAAFAADALKPETAGPEGKRAFDDLGRFYNDPQKLPPFPEALDALKGDDAASRQKAGEYLLALFKQSWADEDNGRAPWRKSPFFGEGSKSAAREFRQKLAEEFGNKAEGDAALDAALWLIDVERLPNGQEAGITVLRRTKGDKASAALKRLLAPPHPCAAVAVGAVELVGERKLKNLGTVIVPLCGHHRTDLRQAARKTAEQLGLTDIPAFKLEDAFTPRLEKQLADIAAMVQPPIPKDAKWVTVTRQVGADDGDKPRTVRVTGWLVGEAGGKQRLVDWFGEEMQVPKDGAEVKEQTLADTAERFRALRAGKGEDAREAMGELSRRGMLTAQFQPRFLSQPELLVGAWAMQRGDRKTAAAVLFDRIDQMRDDRWLTEIGRDLLGHQYHQEMLEAFCYRRDYDRALVLAKHLSQPIFDNYQYQQRAKNLAKQMPLRSADFKTVKLPAPEEWQGLQAKLSRPEQIKFLAERLRLLNCRQWGQPGGVNYEDEQNSASFDQGHDKGKPVINPYNELGKLKLEPGDLPPLVPFLGDDNYVLVFSYWRDFHPNRTLHQVNWLVVDLVNDVAAQDLAELGTFNRLDEKGRKAHLDKIVAWCKDNAGKTRDQLLLDTLAKTQEWNLFARAAGELVAKHNAKALPVLVERMKVFTDQRGAIAELVANLETADAVGPARSWIEGDDEKARFWGALILLRHGDKAKAEGLQPLRAILAKDDGTYYYPRAIDTLLMVRTEEAEALASGILKKKGFHADLNRGEILGRLFVACRTEALDYLLAGLDSTKDGGTSSGTYKGKRVQRQNSEGDKLAGEVAHWRTDHWEFETLAPDEERKARRDELKTWLKAQFLLIKSGEKPALRTDNHPLHFPEWHVDAP